MAWFWLLLLVVQPESIVGHVTTVTSKHGIAMFMPLELVNRTSFSPHPSQGARRGRELLANARMNLHDDLLTKGYYTSRVSIGTPPHEFALIVDTGSTVTYVPCSSCSHCGNHQDPRFSPASSSSYKEVACGSECPTGNCDGRRCTYQRQYAEMSSSSGVLGKDLITFSNSSELGRQELMFGCETDERGDLYDQTADGIMGLGRGSLSIVDQLVKQKSMEDVFSLCYGGMDVGGGAMIMGGFVPPSDMVFTYSNPNRSPYYNLILKEIQVAGEPLNVKPDVFDGKYGTVLDSGTTYAYFPASAYDSFSDTVKKQVGSLHQVAGPDPHFNDICYAGAGTNVSELSNFFPSVDLIFEDGVKLTLTPENYLFRHTKVPGAYCLGVFKNVDQTTLLGGIIVRNMLVTYNRGKSKIGFLKTDCNNLWSKLSNSFPPPEHSVQPSEFLYPPAPAPAPAPDARVVYGHGAIEISMTLGTNCSTFSNLTMEFMKDVVRELGINLNQVSIVNISSCGSPICVNLVVVPTNADLNNTAERIISRLEHHEVHLSEVFGYYNLTGWKLIHNVQKQTGEQHKTATGTVILAACVLVVCVAGVIIFWQLWRFRNKKHAYETLPVEGEALTGEAAGVQLQQL